MWPTFPQCLRIARVTHVAGVGCYACTTSYLCCTNSYFYPSTYLITTSHSTWHWSYCNRPSYNLIIRPHITSHNLSISYNPILLSIAGEPSDDKSNGEKGLFPHVINLATRARITANATCGQSGSEVRRIWALFVCLFVLLGFVVNRG